jgi:hypothetical protein
MAFKRRHKVYSLTLNYKGTPLQFKVRAVHVSAVQCEFYWEGPEPESRHYRFATGRVCNVTDRDAMVHCLQHNLDSIWTNCLNYIQDGITESESSTSYPSALERARYFVKHQKVLLPKFELVYPEGNRIYSSSYTPRKMYDTLFMWTHLNGRTLELADISVDYGI